MCACGFSWAFNNNLCAKTDFFKNVLSVHKHSLLFKETRTSVLEDGAQAVHCPAVDRLHGWKSFQLGAASRPQSLGERSDSSRAAVRYGEEVIHDSGRESFNKFYKVLQRQRAYQCGACASENRTKPCFCAHIPKQELWQTFTSADILPLVESSRAALEWICLQLFRGSLKMRRGSLTRLDPFLNS